jgi:hypothetical protein
MNTPADIAKYVDAATALHGLPLTPEQRQRVIDTFGLNAALIAPLLAYPLAADMEQAPVFNAAGTP